MTGRQTEPECERRTARRGRLTNPAHAGVHGARSRVSYTTNTAATTDAPSIIFNDEREISLAKDHQLDIIFR